MNSAIQNTDYFLSQSCSSLTSNVRPKAIKIRPASSEHNLATLAVQLTVASSSSGHPILLSLAKAFFPSFLLSHLGSLHEFKLSDKSLNFNDPPFIRLILDSLVQPPDEEIEDNSMLNISVSKIL
jgi:hypothetical protein